MGLTIERKKKKEKEPLEYATRDCAFQTQSKRISDSALNRRRRRHCRPTLRFQIIQNPNGKKKKTAKD
jgi:hypothetical protein